MQIATDQANPIQSKPALDDVNRIAHSLRQLPPSRVHIPAACLTTNRTHPISMPTASAIAERQLLDHLNLNASNLKAKSLTTRLKENLLSVACTGTSLRQPAASRKGFHIKTKYL
jgi:hypothetical protein